MRHTRASFSSILLIGLLLAAVPTTIAADQPALIPSWYEGEVVHFIVPSDKVVDVGDRLPHRVHRPLYAFGLPGDQPQFDVIGVAPGDAQYSPWWEGVLVIVLDGRDVSANPFTSEQEILDAAVYMRQAIYERDGE